jgi:predicted nucleic acid-binding protein
MDFVLDNSVAMRWLLRDGHAANQRYAQQVLASLADRVAAVPALWWLELANAIAKSERKQLVSQADSELFLRLLTAQAIEERTLPGALLLDKTLALARQHAISSYDAAYLVLSMQLQLPLATLDAALQQAALKMGVPLYLIPAA